MASVHNHNLAIKIIKIGAKPHTGPTFHADALIDDFIDQLTLTGRPVMVQSLGLRPSGFDPTSKGSGFSGSETRNREPE